MAFLGETINAGDVPEQDNDFDPIPDGWYSCMIAGAELKDTKAGNGSYISVRFDVTGPTHEGRVVFTNLNIKNPNPKAEEIGRQQLDSLIRACGIPSIEDTDQLIGGYCAIKVTTKKSTEWGDSNEIKGYKSLNESAAPMPKAEAKPEAEASKPPPWKK